MAYATSSLGKHISRKNNNPKTMAQYKYNSNLEQNQHQAFDQVLHPGTPTPYSGIYRCEGCGVNEVSTHTHPLPPQNHHQHTAQQGAVRWKLIVATH